MSTATAVTERPVAVVEKGNFAPLDVNDDDFAPLDVKVVVATHPHGKLMCSTNDGCGSSCSGGSSACSSFIEDPA